MKVNEQRFRAHDAMSHNIAKAIESGDQHLIDGLMAAVDALPDARERQALWAVHDYKVKPHKSSKPGWTPEAELYGDQYYPADKDYR